MNTIHPGLLPYDLELPAEGLWPLACELLRCAEDASAAASSASIRLSIPSSCLSSAEAVCSPLENTNVSTSG